jgi:excinuclease ABC subunit A
MPRSKPAVAAATKRVSAAIEVKAAVRAAASFNGGMADRPARPKPDATRSAAPLAPAGPATAAGRPPIFQDGRLIRVRGAKEHNLKNIDVELPRDRLVVITGLSGSGKSSLAFDTIFAEGQRKYMESLSAYARQFLEQLKKPDVEEIEGIPPTIAIEQRSASSNPRSTVATTTEIYDYLRLLYARCGRPVSWAPTKMKKDGTVLERSGRPISATTSTQIVDTVMGWAGKPVLAPESSGPESRETDPGPGSVRPESRKGSGPATQDSGPRSPQATRRGETQDASLRLMILAPVLRGKKGFHREVLEDLLRQGWQRSRVNGTLIDLREALKEPGENPLGLGRHNKHTIEAVIDRIVLRPDVRQRLAESIEAALKLAGGAVIVSREGTPNSARGIQHAARGTDWTDTAFSTTFADPDNPEYALEELSPRLFSFNSPFGACPECHGLGTIFEFDEARIIPDDSLSLGEGAVSPWQKAATFAPFYRRRLRFFARNFGVSMDTPVSRFSSRQRRILLKGTTPDDAEEYGTRFEGVEPGLHSWFEKTESAFVKEFLQEYMTEKPCPACRGDRLRIEALHVLLESCHGVDPQRVPSGSVIGRPPAGAAGSPSSLRPSDSSSLSFLNIAEFCRLTITEASAYIAGLQLTREQATIAEPILKEVNNRLRFLMSVGLEYLSLDRRTATLSGGEAQRIRLATQVGSGLVGACYVLDEPTIGLHQRDNARLIRTLRHLTDIGNTVLVVEHDEDMIRAADWVLDIGPGPGVHGGRVVAQGSVEDICATPGSITGDYLAHRRRIEVPARRRPLSEKNALCIRGARQNNLRRIDVAFPLGGLVCITGVSGSGKSTLVNDILLAAARRELLGSRDVPGAHDRITGLSKIDRIIEVDQSPIGRTPRSNPATYTGIFDDIRRVFAQTKEAKIRGYQPGRFSFNVPAQRGGGRCEACQGQGLKKIEMHFLPDVYVECEVCGGKRYNRETLEVTYRGKSIADVLAMTVEEALGFFENHPLIRRFVRCLHDVGLDYIQLGQPSTTLSGGEAQRVKLATELGKAGGTKNNPVIEGLKRALPGEAGPGNGEEPDALAELASHKPRARGRIASPLGHTLYILDEPTTGLHFEDIRKLCEVFDRLADGGNTLVVIEHNLDVIKRADWIIDLGPEGGDRGGTVIAAGPPERVATTPGSFTGEYLRPMLPGR